MKSPGRLRRVRWDKVNWQSVLKVADRFMQLIVLLIKNISGDN